MVSLTVKVVLQGAENDSKYRDVAPLRGIPAVVFFFFFFFFFFFAYVNGRELELTVHRRCLGLPHYEELLTDRPNERLRTKLQGF